MGQISDGMETRTVGYSESQTVAYGDLCDKISDKLGLNYQLGYVFFSEVSTCQATKLCYIV